MFKCVRTFTYMKQENETMNVNNQKYIFFIVDNLMYIIVIVKFELAKYSHKNINPSLNRNIYVSFKNIFKTNGRLGLLFGLSLNI